MTMELGFMVVGDVPASSLAHVVCRSTGAAGEVTKKKPYTGPDYFAAAS
jgi:hypothetical protein